MRYVLGGLGGVLAIILVLFLSYTMPRQDVVRIVNTEVRRIDTSRSLFFASSEGTTADGTRDVKLINAIRQNGKPAVYRNEDTGWGWPPFFKFDSSDLQAEAADLQSTKEAPRWVVVKRYGWRSQLFSIYPNALKVSEVATPSDKPLPWGNIMVFAGLAALIFVIWRGLKRFYARRIDPVVDRVTDVFDGDDDEPAVVGANTMTASRSQPAPKKKGFFGRLFG